MAQPRFSIGIDLGTSNSALAFSALDGDGTTEILPVPQWDGETTRTEAATLPSALYWPETPPDGAAPGWIVGRLARRKAGEVPGRVVLSAKSWLCHHAADRSARFLPWGGDEIAIADKISPVEASALILRHLWSAWDARFAAQGPDYCFEAQDITITVPASFDAVAQRLTLDAARDARFPERTRLLEEPQAAFAWWLEQRHGGGDIWAALPDPDNARHHVLVVDVGGGTTDFSLFELRRDEDGSAAPRIVRVAVSDHILLGGDNIDLALAHLMEPRLTRGLAPLSAGQWDHLVSSCRALKERALSEDGGPDEVFTLSVPGRGSGLIGGALTADLTRADLDTLLFDGFFPACGPDDGPQRAATAIKEWGLPYAFDGAVTRHLADFLRDRPRIDAVLFNGGSLTPRRLRALLCERIADWQDGQAPQVLENGQLDLAVARGAAYSGWLRHRQSGAIEAGAARAVFIEAHRGEDSDGERSLVCLLPHGAAVERDFEPSGLDLSLRLDRMVSFRVHTSTRHDRVRLGEIVALDPDRFRALPPLETVLQAPEGSNAETIPVGLVARVNELGLLQVSIRSRAPGLDQVWPLDFNLRQQDRPDASADAPVQAEANAPSDKIEAAAARIRAVLGRPAAKGDKLTAPRLLQSLEQILGIPRGTWNAVLLRSLWPSLDACGDQIGLSVEHEEAWLTLAGFLLRPGFGVAQDESRIDALWRLREVGARFPGKRIRVQEQILWRRLAGGLSRERQEALARSEMERIVQAKSAAPELIRMVGAFERLGPDLKADLVRRFIDSAAALAAERKHCAPYLAALGSLLNRTPFHSGPEAVMPAALVERAFEALRGFDWADPELVEAQTLFLRAGRAVADRTIDLGESLRFKIANRLEKCGIAPSRTARLKSVVPVERADLIGYFSDDVPPGLILTPPAR
ncbi:hsp70 family protein [Magnetospirillum fulvum]|uniref:Hsp70 protein n=1 Tax=Magnetospirillum fulvum TaxID=1082 RepID=A0A1H6HI35_MAGFU|nr:hsp70 family protein [Magnetospirillum fulvum]SEH35421.1 Hsp70 protein [Magnetospirillum fulvum]